MANCADDQKSPREDDEAHLLPITHQGSGVLHEQIKVQGISRGDLELVVQVEVACPVVHGLDEHCAHADLLGGRDGPCDGVTELASR
jgi:hypothetical protein